MQVIVHQHLVFELIDVLLACWRAEPKKYPFNRKDAILPQTILPEDLRREQFVLACFYFYTCIYMRGGIESLQAFNALIRMWRAHPHLFDPGHAALMTQPYIQAILKRFIGWDSKAASINWVVNSRRLMQTWRGNPLNLIKNLQNIGEAERRIRNKRLKREFLAAGVDGEGFRGFQPKMVSMLLYFYDWEGWLKPRFLYPSPADFHNFRLGLANRAIVATLDEGRIIRSTEKLSAPWRAAVMAYLKKRGADPIEVSDALWLFSLVMCGNSPVTTTKELNGGAPLFAHAGVEETWTHDQWVVAKKRKQLEQTCLICPFMQTCDFGIPSNPYYRKGQLVLRPRPKVERYINTALLPEPAPEEAVLDEEIQHILSEIMTPVSA